MRDAAPRSNGPEVVVYAARGSTTTRRVRDEAGVEDELAAGLGDEIEVVVFDGRAQTAPADVVGLFRRATVVVGVHGAALANALFCEPGALIVELGPENPAARHYEHLAQAAGLGYARVALDASLAAADVAVDARRLAEVVELVRARVRVEGGGRDEL